MGILLIARLKMNNKRCIIMLFMSITIIVMFPLSFIYMYIMLPIKSSVWYSCVVMSGIKYNYIIAIIIVVFTCMIIFMYPLIYNKYCSNLAIILILCFNIFIVILYTILFLINPNINHINENCTKFVDIYQHIQFIMILFPILKSTLFMCLTLQTNP